MRIFIKQKNTISILVLALSFVFCVNLYASQTALVSDVHLTNTRDDLLVYFKVENAFTDKITEAVLKGVPASFSFYIKLDQVTQNIMNNEVADFKIKTTLKYNALKKEFVVSRHWKNEKPIITDSFKEATRIMTEIDNLAVTELVNLKKGEKYELELKAKLDKVTLPLYLHYILFFVSFWDFETDWHVIKFTY
ncbi:MAG: DUF4390 domain-containing protein [Desulfobacteraceae bacterium]|nr:DUF4390 domain-containing protein [Desulfobacteraceae bacterium]